MGHQIKGKNEKKLAAFLEQAAQLGEIDLLCHNAR